MLSRTARRGVVGGTGTDFERTFVTFYHFYSTVPARREKKQNTRNLRDTKLLLKSTTADTLTEHKLSGLLDCSALQWDVFG